MSNLLYGKMYVAKVIYHHTDHLSDVDVVKE